MSSSDLVRVLNALPSVEIDADGVFKYVLIEVTAEDGEGNETSRLLVRGNASAEYHADVYDELEESVRAKGLDSQCLGGGRIQHDSRNKKIKVYGYSVGFGKADHTKAVALLKAKYPGYDITWNDEGY